MMTKTGVVQFSAPEIFCQSEYDEKVDVWSAGIILYMMLSGTQPFLDPSMHATVSSKNQHRRAKLQSSRF